MENSAQSCTALPLGERFRKAMKEAQAQGSLKESALVLARHGFNVFPCCSDSGRGKKPETLPKYGFCGDPELDSNGKPVIDPATRRPKTLSGTGGFHKATTDEGRIAGAWTDRPKSLVGIVPQGRLAMVDLDVPGEGHSGDGNGIETVKALEKKHGEKLRTFATRTPSGGLHLWFTLPDGVDLPQDSKLLPGIDTRTAGKGYSIDVGTMENGGRYGVHEDAPVAVMPAWLVQELLDGKERKRKAREKTERTAETVATQVNLSMFHDGQRIHEVPASYYENAFRRECDRLCSAPAGERNNALNRSCFNVGQLVAEGGVDEEQAKDAMERIAVELGLSGGEISATIRSGIESGKRKRRVARERDARVPEPVAPMVDFISLEDATQLESRDYTVKGLIPARGVVQIYGEPACGKSFTALSLCIHIAEGWQLCDRKVKKRPVYYLQLEGAGGLGRRLQAFKVWMQKAHKPSLNGIFRFWTHSFSLNDAGQCTALCEAINGAGHSGAVVVIDTQSQATLGVDENTSEMATAIGNATRIAEGVCGTVILIHHVGKDVTKGARGHSSQLGNVDCAIFASKDKRRKTVNWTVTKAKDDPDGYGATFKLHVFELGYDEDGDSVTSCVAEPVVPSTPDKENASDAQKLPYGGLLKPGSNAAFAFDTFLEASSGETSVTLDEWRAIYYKRSTAASVGSKRSQFNSDRKALVSKGILHVDNDVYTIDTVVAGIEEKKQ